MKASARLETAEISERLSAIPGWALENNSLRRVFKFSDFASAFGFMTVVAFRAEAMNHHPDWSNVYSTVSVALSTHDAGGITEKDFALAAVMDEFAKRYA